MSQRHLDDVLNQIPDPSVSWAVDVESLFVDGLVDKLVNDRLWDSLGLSHQFLFQENLLPVKLILLLV